MAGPRPGAATPPLGGAQSSNTGTPQGPTTTTIKLTVPPAHPGTSNTRPSGVDPAAGDPASTGGVAHPSSPVSFRPKKEKTGVPGQLGCEFVSYGRDEEWRKMEQGFPEVRDWQKFPHTRRLVPHSLDLTKETLHPTLLQDVHRRMQKQEHNPLVFQSRWVNTPAWNSPLDSSGRPTLTYQTPLEGYKTQNLVAQLISRDIGNDIPAKNIGLVVAGNSGLPGGGIAEVGEFGATVVPDNIKAGKWVTQEESLVSNWIWYQVAHKNYRNATNSTSLPTRLSLLLRIFMHVVQAVMLLNLEARRARDYV